MVARGNLLGVVLSFVLIGIGFATYYLVSKKDKEVARKCLHIIVGNWFFIFRFFFTENIYAILGLLFFAVLNLILEIKVIRSERFGMIYYPVSIVAMLCFYSAGMGSMRALGCGILAMAYGDGLAAVVGGKITSQYMPFQNRKTVVGSLTMFVVTTVVVLLFGVPFSVALLVGLTASIIEAYTPFGLDNLLVPFAVFWMVSKLC